MSNNTIDNIPSVLVIAFLLLIAYTIAIGSFISNNVESSIYTSICRTLEYDGYSEFNNNVYCVEYETGNTMLIYEVDNED